MLTQGNGIIHIVNDFDKKITLKIVYIDQGFNMNASKTFMINFWHGWYTEGGAGCMDKK